MGQIKGLELLMRDSSFSGEDPTLFLDFLSRFVDEAGTLEMSEAQKFIPFPYFLKGQAAAQFRSAKTVSSRSDRGTSNWTRAIQ